MADLPDKWRLLYSAAIAMSFCYRFPRADTLNAHLADDACSAGSDAQEHAADEIAADRGKVTFERFAQAAIDVFEHRLRATGKDALREPWRTRYIEHVAQLRHVLAKATRPVQPKETL